MFKDRSISIPVLLLSGLALLVGTALIAKPEWVAKPAYRLYKTRRALQLVTVAREKYFPARDWASVDRNLRLANAFAPTEPEVLRLSARFLAVGNREATLQYYSMLMNTGAATITDRLEYARQGLLHDRPDITRLQVREILLVAPRHRDALLAGIEALERLGLADDALRLAQTTFQAYPSDDEAALHVGLLQMARPDPIARAAGHRLLWGLAISRGAMKTRAIERLAQDTTLPRSELDALAHALAAMPSRTLAQDLSWFDLRVRLAPPGERSALATLAVQRLGAEPSLQDRLQVADWLLAHQLPERVGEAISEELSRQSAVVAQRWLQAKANAGKWDEVVALIDDNTMSIAPELRHCYRALVEFRAGNTNAVARHLKLAIAVLKTIPDHVAVVSGYAEKLGQPKLAAQAQEKLLSDPIHVHRAAREIIRLLGTSDDVQELLTTLRRLRQFQPNSLELADLISWFELVTRQRIGVNAAAAKERVNKEPQSDRFRLTLALAELRQDNPEAALALLEGKNLDRTNAPPRARLLYVAALGAAGQRQTAQRLAQVLDLTPFKPEEIELIRPWRELSNP